MVTSPFNADFDGDEMKSRVRDNSEPSMVPNSPEIHVSVITAGFSVAIID
jgi:hypothetical protein